jgi:hypothetical protein
MRTWDVIEAMQPDPYRPDAQQWITSYASLYHKPGVPLFDLMQIGKAVSDPRMLFSWYAANYCTDPDFAGKTSEERANPSMPSWGQSRILSDQQRRRLSSHKYRRLHLNLPGLPEGSAYQPEPIMDAIARGVPVRAAELGIDYFATRRSIQSKQWRDSFACCASMACLTSWGTDTPEKRFARNSSRPASPTKSRRKPPVTCMRPWNHG